MPSPTKKIPSAAGKKRKQVDIKSANDGSGPPKKKHRYECSADGCTNRAINGKGGVCMRHGAKVKVKRCSVEGCTNQSKRAGVCQRHSAYRNPHDESTAFASCFGSEFDKTTLTHPNQHNATASASQEGSVPEEVVIAPNNNVVEV